MTAINHTGVETETVGISLMLEYYLVSAAQMEIDTEDITSLCFHSMWPSSTPLTPGLDLKMHGW